MMFKIFIKLKNPKIKKKLDFLFKYINICIFI